VEFQAAGVRENRHTNCIQVQHRHSQAGAAAAAAARELQQHAMALVFDGMPLSDAQELDQSKCLSVLSISAFLFYFSPLLCCSPVVGSSFCLVLLSVAHWFYPTTTPLRST
jgi:hypothetical protein